MEDPAEWNRITATLASVCDPPRTDLETALDHHQGPNLELEEDDHDALESG